MKERPILFQGAMVRALLDGSKTQTRRVVKDLPPWDITEICSDAGGTGKWMPNGPSPSGTGMAAGHWRDCPYGRPGDRLWVRESFWGCDLPGYGDQPCVVYDDEWVGKEYCPAKPRPWGRKFGRIPSIHMPRDCSRILLEIVSVRVERLNDCSEADAIAEGCARNDNGYYWGGPHSVSGTKQLATARKAYRDLWESINGAGSWAANPWVWCVEFSNVTP